jgi:pseudo-rSAM protein
MNIMEIKDCWFALKSSVYVEFKSEKILLYDTQTGNHVVALFESAIALINELYKPENLGVMLLHKDLQKDPGIQNFVGEILGKKMGDLLEIERVPQKPVRLVPILNLQRDIDKLKNKQDVETLIGKDVINYLLGINIYLNDKCNKNCLHCKKYCTQIPCCTANHTDKKLSVSALENIFRQIKYSPIGRVNILGGNILKYAGVSNLQKALLPFENTFQNVLHYYLHYENYEQNEVIESSKLELIVNFPINEKLFNQVYSVINKEKTTIHFVIEDENQYSETKELIETLNIEKHTVFPFYTGKNFNFFRDNLFTCEEDIFSETLSIREIFRNKKLNSNFFGTLYIFPDGNVKANINMNTLGNINSVTILEFLCKELLENTAWRKIRDSKPCNECLYQFFCPAPSDYERAIGRENLCHVVEDT